MADVAASPSHFPSPIPYLERAGRRGGRMMGVLLWPFRWLAWLILRTLFALRYRVKVVGKPEVFKKRGPYLILPNHPGLVDPPLIIGHLWPAFKARPLLLET